MRELDSKSLAVSAVIGALFLYFFYRITVKTSSGKVAIAGALTGIVVQVGLRTFGVS